MRRAAIPCLRPVALGLLACGAALPLSAAAQTSDQAASPSSQPLAPQPSASQPPPAKPDRAATDKAGTVTGVTVTSQANQTQLSIDRRSYDVSRDLQTTTGSIADALRNVPSVDVDLNGKVSLRGDPNVTIMIDGRPSNMFKGPGAGLALQSLPADQIERVEVITNPTAAYSPEGTAGIINLVTKKGRGAGASGSVRANLGTGGRRSAGASASYNSARLTLSGDASWRTDPQHSISDTAFTAIDPSTGAATTTQEHADVRGPLSLWNVRGGADYDVTDATRLSAELRHTDFRFHPQSVTTERVLGPSGAEVGAIDEGELDLGPDRRDTEGRVGLRHKFAGDDHVLTVDLSRERTREDTDTTESELFEQPVQPKRFRQLGVHNRLIQTELKADYSRPMPAAGKLKTGYDLKVDDNDYLNTATLGTSAADAQPDPGQTNFFRYRRSINAAYATYEQPFGDLTVLAGLRLEDVRLRLNDPTTRFAAGRDELDAYPTLHLAYRLSDVQQLTLSYSHRVQRPDPGDLDPFRFIQGFSARQGNPDLRNADTHAFEAGWQYKAGGTYYLATAFYRLNEHGFTDVLADIGGGVLLDTPQNLVKSRNAGLELVANGHLGKTLSYNLSGDLYYAQIDAQAGAGTPGFAGKRSALTGGGRASLSWQPTAKDLFQVSGQLTARKLTPQGFIEPMTLIFLGYRHRFDDRLSLVVTAQDPFDIYRFKQVLDTPALTLRSTARGRIQAAFVGLVWSFGAAGKRPHPADFDFSAPQ